MTTPSTADALGLLHAYLAPLAALAMAVAGSVLCRKRPDWLPAAAALALLAGWALLLPEGVALRALAGPRTLPEFLLAPAAAAALGLAAASRVGGRVERWMPVALAAFAGWWLAASPAGRPEFWRVWFAAGLLAWLLSRAAGGLAVRSLAAGLALWGGLLLAGAGGWAMAGLVAAAAAAGLLAAGPRAAAALPASLLMAVVLAADLGAGRAIRGGLNGADLACLAACAAPPLAGVAAPRLARRLGGGAPVAAALLSAILAIGAAWLAQRMLRR